MNRKGILIVVSGFSGSGKGTLMKELLSNILIHYALSVRPTRAAKRWGTGWKRIFFISKDEFEKMIAKDELIEYARYVKNCTVFQKSMCESSWIGKRCDP